MTTDTGSSLDEVKALIALATGDERHEESSTSTLDALFVLYDAGISGGSAPYPVVDCDT
jgi:hypothetical protein